MNYFFFFIKNNKHFYIPQTTKDPLHISKTKNNNIKNSSTTEKSVCDLVAFQLNLKLLKVCAMGPGIDDYELKAK